MSNLDDSKQDDSKLDDSKKPVNMPRELFKKLKKQHKGGSQLDQGVILKLLDLLTAREKEEEDDDQEDDGTTVSKPSPHPAEAEFERLVGLNGQQDAQNPAPGTQGEPRQVRAEEARKIDAEHAARLAEQRTEDARLAAAKQKEDTARAETRSSERVGQDRASTMSEIGATDPAAAIQHADAERVADAPHADVDADAAKTKPGKK